MKRYLVWNETNNEGYATDDYDDAYYAIHGDFPEGKFKLGLSALAEQWHESYGDEKCTLTEINI